MHIVLTFLCFETKKIFELHENSTRSLKQTHISEFSEVIKSCFTVFTLHQILWFYFPFYFFSFCFFRLVSLGFFASIGTRMIPPFGIHWGLRIFYQNIFVLIAGLRNNSFLTLDLLRSSTRDKKFFLLITCFAFWNFMLKYTYLHGEWEMLSMLLFV